MAVNQEVRYLMTIFQQTRGSSKNRKGVVFVSLLSIGTLNMLCMLLCTNLLSTFNICFSLPTEKKKGKVTQPCEELRAMCHMINIVKGYTKPKSNGFQNAFIFIMIY